MTSFANRPIDKLSVSVDCTGVWLMCRHHGLSSADEQNSSSHHASNCTHIVSA